MYLHTFGEKENGSILEEPFEGKNLSKLNLCDDGECPESEAHLENDDSSIWVFVSVSRCRMSG